MSLSTLANTKWELYEYPDLDYALETTTFYVNFKANGKIYSSVTTIIETETVEEEEVTTKTVYFGETPLYDGTEAFPAAYRTVEIIDGADVADADLITLLGLWGVRIDITENFRVIRQTLDGTSQEYDFGSPGMQFLVKNLSDGDILVNFEDLTDDNATASALIPKETAQVIVTNTGYPKKEFQKIYVKGSGTGDVEIQMILW